MNKTIRARGWEVSVGDAVRRLNQNVFGKLDAETKEILNSAPLNRRIKQKTKGPNLLEQSAMEYLSERNGLSRLGLTVRHHALTLLLANGVRYTPDITGFSPKHDKLHAWEIKGKHAWDDAIVKLKVAAHEWPNIQFYLMWKDDGVWQTQHILA